MALPLIFSLPVPFGCRDESGEYAERREDCLVP